MLVNKFQNIGKGLHCLNLIDRRQLSEDVAKVGLETKGKDEISLIDDQHGQGGGQV